MGLSRAEMWTELEVKKRGEGQEGDEGERRGMERDEREERRR